MVAVDQHGARLHAPRHEADHGGEVAQQILTWNITDLVKCKIYEQMSSCNKTLDMSNVLDVYLEFLSTYITWQICNIKF